LGTATGWVSAFATGRTTAFPHLLQNDAVSGLGAPQELQNMAFQALT
jgi:hypothetical protein